jgi:Xaa-Pro aminopeptidase
MPTVDHPRRRAYLADRFGELGVEALLVTRQVNVRYLTGFSGSNGQLLVTADGGGTFFTDSRYEEQSRREVPDLSRVIYPRRFSEALAEAREDRGLRRVGFEAADLSYKAHRELAELDGIELVTVGEEVERLRWAKERAEIALIERAQELTDEAFDRVTAKLAEGITERRVGLELDLAMREAGAERIGFDSIVAFGENAAEPHHAPTDRALRRGDVVKLDFGCVVEGYHSDMTRTVAFGEPDPRLREIHQLVLRAHLAGAQAVRAGATGRAADRAARSVIEEAGYGDRFGHSLGHGVGLEIHEGPSLRRDTDDVLPEGAVVTVEPGVYVPGLGGVRIEDMVVVTAEGCRALPRTRKDLLVL